MLAIAFGIAAPACAFATDLGGFSNGQRETGSAESDGASTPDDGGAIAEGEDGATTLDGSAAASCEHLFCEDFDDDASVSRWQVFLADPSATSFTMRIDTTAASSPPALLLFSASPVRWGEWGYVQKVFDIGATATLRCSFDMRLDVVPPDGFYTLGGFVAAEAEPSHAATLFIRGEGKRIGLVEEATLDGGTLGVVDGPALGVGQWRSYVIALQRGPSPSVTITDGVLVYTMPVPSWPATPKVAFALGVVFPNPYRQESVVLETRYDAIRCDAL